jgi:hypothetical protein
MNQALERLRASKQADVTLPSGLQVTIRLLRVTDFIAAGDVPMPVLDKIRAKAKTNGDISDEEVEQSVRDALTQEELTPEDIRYGHRFNDTIVRMTIIAIEGEPVELTMDDVRLLEAKDCTEVAAYALRTKELPGKAA